MYLNCHTSLSFRYGTLSAEDLFAEATRCGVRKLVITEINNTASYIELARMARRPQRTQTDKSMNDAGDQCPEIAVGIEFRRTGTSPCRGRQEGVSLASTKQPNGKFRHAFDLL